mmetsp:Transcript_13965/g.32801  ORF Transcript_13965/g.32801 Transcript_13965/m.32801 type:complete len:293 (-) Transcript_13965:696-1574(-)
MCLGGADRARSAGELVVATVQAGEGGRGAQIVRVFLGDGGARRAPAVCRAIFTEQVVVHDKEVQHTRAVREVPAPAELISQLRLDPLVACHHEVHSLVPEDGCTILLGGGLGHPCRSDETDLARIIVKEAIRVEGMHILCDLVVHHVRVQVVQHVATGEVEVPREAQAAYRSEGHGLVLDCILLLIPHGHHGGPGATLRVASQGEALSRFQGVLHRVRNHLGELPVPCLPHFGGVQTCAAGQVSQCVKEAPREPPATDVENCLEARVELGLVILLLLSPGQPCDGNPLMLQL